MVTDTGFATTVMVFAETEQESILFLHGTLWKFATVTDIFTLCVFSASTLPPKDNPGVVHLPYSFLFPLGTSVGSSS